MARSMLVGLAMFLLLVMALPVQAGRVDVVNNSRCALEVAWDSYIFGIQFPFRFCVDKKKSDYIDDVWLSVGQIRVKRIEDGVAWSPAGPIYASCDAANTQLILILKYNVVGAWLPHRKFRVEVDEKWGVTVTEW